jgi:prophage antirepressor-like protein
MKFNEIVQQFQHNVFGNLTTIRSFKDRNKIWFIGKEIQHFLGHSNLTQAIKAASLEEDEILILKKMTTPEFFNELTNLKLVSYGKRSSSMTFVSESGLYKLILRSRKPETKIFYNWVTKDVLPTLRQSVEEHLVFKKASVEIGKHLDIAHQKFESKKINGININSVGVSGTVEYNRNSCFDHSGKTPSQLKRWAERNGVPASKRTSGKEVLRLVDMPTASSMSLHDSLVSSGIPYNKALEVTNSVGKELFKKLIEIGYEPKELYL